MSRKDDLEHLIRDSYDIISQYEEMVQTSDRPEEVQRAQRRIEEQWGLIRGPLVEYLALCRRRGLAVPEEISEIAAAFGPELEGAVAAYRPPLLPLPSGRGWIYGVVALAVLLVGVIAVVLTRTVGPAATPELTPTLTPVPPTETETPTATATPTPLPPSPTPTPTPIFGQEALYRVAISQFDARHDTQPVEITQRLEDDLRANLRSAGLADDVEVRVVPDVIGTEDQAQNFASDTESDVLIWGWYDSLGIRLYVLLGEGARTGAPNVTGLHELPFSAANETRELSFYVHDVLPSNTTFLSMFVIGHLYYLSNNYAEGYKAFDAAMASIPETVALENEALLHFFNARLMHTTTYTNPVEIVCEYAKAIELDPDLFEAYNNLAVLIMDVCEDRENWVYLSEACISSLEVECVLETGIPSLQPSYLLSRTLQIRPDWALAWHNLAALDWNYATYGYGDVARMTQHAEESFKTVLELDPTVVGAHIMLGNLAIWNGNFDLAVEHFSAATDLWLESPEVRVNLGQALALAGQDEEAIAAYQQALALSPEGSDAYLEAHLALGNLYHRQGDLDRAYQEYRLIQPFSVGQDSSFDYTLSLALAKYEIDTGAWVSATQRIEVTPCGIIRGYLLWLIHSIQGDPEAEKYVFDGGIGGGLFEFWTLGDAGRMTWSEIYEECFVPDADITVWGSESNPCLPSALEDRLEAVYARIQRHVHDRLFFNMHAITPIGACPYVFTYDDQHHGWFPDTTILYELVGSDAKTLQARPLARFDGRLWLRELEPETSYVDQLYVRVLTADDGWLTLVPDDPALAADDGDYLVLRQGDERLLEFALPPGALPVQQAWVVADGYYVPYGHDKEE